MPDQIETYVETAMDQVRWKKARPGLAAEIRTHLLDQRDACLAQGMDEGAAQGEAVRQMGDPVALGTDLDRVHRPRPQWGLLVFALALAALGTMVRLFLTMDTPSEIPGLTHIIGGVLGAVCLAAGYRLDVSALGRVAGWLCLGFLIVITPMLPIWVFSWQESEVPAIYLLLILFPLTLALLLWRLRGRGWPGLLGALAWALLCGVLCLLIPRLLAFSQVILSTLVLGLFFTCRDWFGVGKRLGTVLVAAFALAFAVLLPVGTNYLGSLRNNVFPMLYPSDIDNYIPYISANISTIRAALSGAKWLGPVDPSLLVTEDGFPRVPNMDSDNLLTNLICSWGWLPFLAVVGAFAALFLWMLWKTLRLRQTLGRAVCLGGLMALGVQAVFSLLLNLGVPLFAASFPLVVGNTGTVLNMFLIGLMLSAFRDGAMPEERPAERLLTVPAVSWVDGVLTVNFKGRTLSE